MSSPAPRRPTILFISGTDTDVGKTYCSAMIARRLIHSGVRLGVYKPVASGCRRQVEGWIADDARLLWLAADKPRTLREVCPQCFEAPLAPPRRLGLLDWQSIHKNFAKGPVFGSRGISR